MYSMKCGGDYEALRKRIIILDWIVVAKSELNLDGSIGKIKHWGKYIWDVGRDQLWGTLCFFTETEGLKKGIIQSLRKLLGSQAVPKQCGGNF